MGFFADRLSRVAPSATITMGTKVVQMKAAGRKPRDLPEFQWIYTVLGNLKTSFAGSYHAFDFQKYASRYIAAFTYRFNRRFDLKSLHHRLLVAAAFCAPHPQRAIRLADDYC